MGDDSDLAGEADPVQGHHEAEEAFEGQKEEESLERERLQDETGKSDLVIKLVFFAMLAKLVFTFEGCFNFIALYFI